MPEPVLRPFPWRRLAQIAMALAVLATALSFANRKWGVWERQTGDLPVYLRAAERLSAGEEIYRPEDRKPFTYPPFLALPPVPLSKLPVWAHRSTWYCLNLLVVCVLVALVRRHVARFIAGRSRPFWILLAFLSVRHVAAAFQNQTNDLFIALAVLLCADWAARRRELGSGAFAGIGAAIKATPLLFAPVMLWQRRWRAAAAVLVATAALTLLPDMIAPREDGSLWAKAWYDTFLSDMAPGKTAGKVGNAWAATNILNQNLAGTITRLSTPVSGDGNMQIDAAVWHPSPGVLLSLIHI